MKDGAPLLLRHIVYDHFTRARVMAVYSIFSSSFSSGGAADQMPLGAAPRSSAHRAPFAPLRLVAVTGASPLPTTDGPAHPPPPPALAVAFCFSPHP